MAEEKKGSLFFRPRFLLFFLYLVGYGVLRFYGDIVHQVVEVKGTPGVARDYIVGTNPTLPRWQRQTYRAIFSPLMVGEEEIRRLAGQGMGGLMQNVGEYTRQLLPD